MLSSSSLRAAIARSTTDSRFSLVDLEGYVRLFLARKSCQVRSRVEDTPGRGVLEEKGIACAFIELVRKEAADTIGEC